MYLQYHDWLLRCFNDAVALMEGEKTERLQDNLASQPVYPDPVCCKKDDLDDSDEIAEMEKYWAKKEETEMETEEEEMETEEEETKGEDREDTEGEYTVEEDTEEEDTEILGSGVPC
ncbi:hypothetical protein L218DRAFT_962411 [Marasmius fiardii PR-910]|nr:hypothetical protein L218DRAFT_962411 [Marasmius fiardii PR-910]